MDIEAESTIEQTEQSDNSLADVLVADNAPVATKLHLRGVDDLSTPEIKSYLDLHIKPGYCYDKRDEYLHLQYHLEWINDSELNVCFDSKVGDSDESAQRGANEALNNLVARTPGEEFNVGEEPLKEQKAWDLIRILEGKFKGKRVIKSAMAREFAQAAGFETISELEEAGVVYSDPVAIFVRYATANDRKVSNAREQSRYYLLHGEPDQLERRPAPRAPRRKERLRFYEDGQPDLITGEVRVARDNRRNDVYRSRDDDRRTNDRNSRNRGRASEFGSDDTYGGRPARGNRRRQRREKVPTRDLEDDLFPELLARKNAERERDLSPSRMEK